MKTKNKILKLEKLELKSFKTSHDNINNHVKGGTGETCTTSHPTDIPLPGTFTLTPITNQPKLTDPVMCKFTFTVFTF